MSERKCPAVSAGWLRKVPVRVRITFFSAVLGGLAAHGMGLFNKFSWHDDIIALFWVGTTIPSGRWMLHVVGWLETLLFGDGHFSLPLVNGLFSICCAGLAAVLTAELLDIRKKRYCAALGFLTAVFPVMAGFFGFLFTMPYYLLAMLMMTLSAFLICRRTPLWAKAAAVLLGGCSVGIYQAFIPLLLSLPLLYDIRQLAEGEEPLPALAKQWAVQLLCIAGVMLFYFGMNRFFLEKFGVELGNYMGISEVGSTSLSAYLQRAGRAYREFFLPERNVSWDMYPMHLHYLYLVMVCADAVLGLRLVFRRFRSGARGKAALLALLLALFPLACDFIFVMSGTVHGLMTYSLAVQFALFAWLADRLELRRPQWNRVISGAAAALLGLAGVMYVRYDNQCYLKTAFQQQQAVSFFTVLAARVKGTPGYTGETPVVFLNGEHISDQTLYNIDELDFIHQDPYAEDLRGYLNTYSWRAFMERWCGFGPVWGDEAAVAELPEVRTMPHYPDDGSVRMADGVLVVNF